MKKVLSVVMLGIFLISGCGAAVVSPSEQIHLQVVDDVCFSQPTIHKDDMYCSVTLPEATTYAATPGNPVLPMYTKRYVFPFGTVIHEVTASSFLVNTIALPTQVRPAEQITPVSDTSLPHDENSLRENTEVYTSTDPYPLDRLQYQLGAGLDGNDHVIFVIVSYSPVQYVPQQQRLLFTPDVQITINYELPAQPLRLLENDDLLLIAPEGYMMSLQPLITHKNQHGVATMTLSREDIVAAYPGRDDEEKIKYAIKDAIETHGVHSVLLVGGVDAVPIRTSYVSSWGHDAGGVLTEMYYSDIYNAQGNFSSWDTNNNGKFGEPGDNVDLFPDVHIGRLACDSVEEVNVVVDKIIHYETETYGADWFNTMIFIGGNTFRWTIGNDGEQNNEILMGIMSQFTPKIIWMSKLNYNRFTISKAITDGAGFLDYSGHGFEHGMGTYTTAGLRMKYYFTRYINGLKNGYELPIMFFDACLTAKIDFVLQDFLDYRQYRVFNLLAQTLGINTSQRRTVYGWAFVKHEGGGAIATVGATRVAYGGIDSGAGKMSIEFFSAYNTSEYLGEMITAMQNEYITDVPNDEFTVEEFILLGDPTLKIGGYPPV